MGELNQLKVIGGASGESFVTTKFDALLELGAQVLALPVPVRHGVLRHGVHSRSPARATTSRASAPRRRASRRARPTCSGWWAPSASARPPCSSASTSRWPTPSGSSPSAPAPSCGGFYDNYTTIPGHRQGHPGRRVHPRLPAAPRGRARRAHAAPGQDRPRATAAHDREAPTEVPRQLKERVGELPVLPAGGTIPGARPRMSKKVLHRSPQGAVRRQDPRDQRLPRRRQLPYVEPSDVARRGHVPARRPALRR
jgi:hypothetical protein